MLLLELAGYVGSHDVRERTVQRMQERYAVDRDQAQRVEETALQLAAQLQTTWGITSRELRSMIEAGKEQQRRT